MKKTRQDILRKILRITLLTFIIIFATRCLYGGFRTIESYLVMDVVIEDLSDEVETAMDTVVTNANDSIDSVSSDFESLANMF
jgi:hypothetical protein